MNEIISYARARLANKTQETFAPCITMRFMNFHLKIGLLIVRIYVFSRRVCHPHSFAVSVNSCSNKENNLCHIQTYIDKHTNVVNLHQFACEWEKLLLLPPAEQQKFSEKCQSAFCSGCFHLKAHIHTLTCMYTHKHIRTIYIYASQRFGNISPYTQQTVMRTFCKRLKFFG